MVVALLAVASHTAAAGCDAPEGMICIPSGSFYMGRNDGKRDQGPRHFVKISAFYIDETLVTNKAFGEFVKNSGYKTTAEIRGYGMVGKEGLKNWVWKKVPGANWKRPFGPKLKYFIKNDHPVTSVSWEDAKNYCERLEKRLPTEAEWEYAARAGKSGLQFPWGNKPQRPGGKIGLNFWQGPSHTKNENLDGYLYTSPVKAFLPNDWGMYDSVGNVWQHVHDWYSADYYEETNETEGIQDPKGPTRGKKRVGRGGSWWCSEHTCNGFGLFARGKAGPLAVFNNNGFRCAKDLRKN